MTSSAWHWHLVNREALRGPPEPFRFAAGHPGSISGVVHPRGGGGECRVDVLPIVDMKTGPRESRAPRAPSPTEAPSEKEVQCNLTGINGDPGSGGDDLNTVPEVAMMGVHTEHQVPAKEEGRQVQKFLGIGGS